MSSNAAPERGTLSLALRLTLWYALAAFLLVLATTTYLYFGLMQTLDEEDDQFVLDRVKAIRRVLEASPDDAVLKEVTAGRADRQAGRIYARIFREQSIFQTPGMDEFLPAELFEGADNEDGKEAVGRNGRPALLREERTDRGDRIQVGMDRGGDDEVLARYRERIAIALGSSLILAAIGGLAIARRGLKPLSEVTELAREIGPTHLEARIETSRRPAEVKSLAETINRMLDRLEEAFDRLGRFTADIAHELRTPVNALRTEVEVTLSRPRTEEEYRTALGSCLDESDRLTRLVNSLLLLARAEDPRRDLLTDHIDVMAELKIAQEFYEATASEAGVELQLEVGEPLPLRADRTLIQQAVGNLVANAIKHTPTGGTATLFGTRSEGEIRFGVRDTGGGIAPDHLPHIFQRFYRTSSRRAEGMGLGLAIVEAVARLHGGTAEAASEPGRGTTVTIKIPE